MSRKLRNLENIWKEEGYQILRNHATEEGGVTFDVGVTFKRADGKPINYRQEWNNIKNCASRQSFYAMPEVSGDNQQLFTAQVFVIRKEGVIKGVELWRKVIKSLTSSYWGYQLDPETMQFVDMARDILTLVMGVQVEVKGMHTHTPSKNLLENNITYTKWINYQKYTSYLCRDLLQSEKTSDFQKEMLRELRSLYPQNV